jgi:hypothetical protein
MRRQAEMNDLAASFERWTRVRIIESLIKAFVNKSERR